jgi:glycerophosphoryl diester phosphodiesterase
MPPLLLGHRGARASRQFVENTLQSFELCLEHGCDGFEFDVRRSADGHAVVCHDPTIRGLRIENTPSKELCLPSLKEVLRHYSHRAFLDIELKVPGLESLVLAALSEHPPKHGYVLSSFLPEVLDRTQSIDRKTPLGFIFDRQSHNPPSHLDLEWTIPHFKLVSRELVEETHGSGERIMVWTVNHSADIQRLIDWGADAIISDDTELLGGFRH